MTTATVMIVEDEPDICEALASLLHEHGYPVVTAGDGLEALCHLRSHPLPGLIILDLMMPKIDGIEFLEAMETEMSLRVIPIVVVSAARELCQALPGPVIARLQKPIDTRYLLATIAQHCRDVPVSPIGGSPAWEHHMA